MTMTAMKDSHRMFIQSFMSKGILNATDVRSLYRKCCEQYNDIANSQEDERKRLQEFVMLINNNIRQFEMEIKKGVSETDGSSFYGMVNTTETSITLLASRYTKDELEFFKKLVELIVDSDTGTVGSIDAVNIADSINRMSKNDAEELLEKFQHDKWIEKTGDTGRYYLATRAVIELEQYIFDMYPALALRCNMCKKLCLQGDSCTQCNTKLHFHCGMKYFHGQQELKCPNADCRAPWTNGVERYNRNKPTDRGPRDTDQTAQPETSTQSRKRKANS